MLIRDLPDQLKGWEPLDWVFRTVDFKAGAFEIDYGDAHYRRSNNAAVQANPLIGNYVVDPRGIDIGMEIMGTTAPVQWLNVTIKEPDADEILVECRTDVQMTDFNITPPTLLAGLIKAGDKIRIVVHWALGRERINR